MNKKNIFLGVVLVVIILIFRAYPFFNTDTMPISLEARNSELNSGKGSNISKYMQSKSAEAKVIGLIPNKSGSGKVSNKVKVKITAGKYKGQIVTVDNLIDNTDTNKNDLEYYNVKKNDEVILHYDVDKGGNITNVYINDFIRYKNLITIVGIFIMLQIIIGGRKGVVSLFTLILTIIFVVKIIMPLILKGNNPVIPTIIICIMILVMNFLLISGFTKKSLGAILGTSLGMIISGILFYISGSILRVTGMSYEDSQTLSEVLMGKTVDIRGIFFCCIMLGALGAIMDIGITISSTMYEIKKGNPNISEKELIKSGMNVGKDIMGTMSNTLILAYLGSAMIMLIIFASDGMSFIEIINQDIVSSEILKALIGGIGIVLTIPITVLINTKLVNLKKSIH
ncbi:YibE/F family protein [Clostridium hydrogenum]|uniref:YibE/F family protein n=1 Tax=Clostridium hydrogenum TaxID=2855764 RepID=UPI001F298291|nr:YibE/F family protein [Clostridium hydrogenum]